MGNLRTIHPLDMIWVYPLLLLWQGDKMIQFSYKYGNYWDKIEKYFVTTCNCLMTRVIYAQYNFLIGFGSIH
jgi:hypothetical protein